MKLAYKEFGKGKPLLILHGLFGFSDNWNSQAKALSLYFKVITVDLRNHGRSPWDDVHSYQVMADDVIETLDMLNIDIVHVIGHSMGGKVAMHLVQIYPQRIKNLVIVDIGVKSYPMHHQEIIRAIHEVPLSDIKARSQVSGILAKRIPQEGVRQFLLKNLFWIEKGRLAWRMNINVLEASMGLILGALPKTEVVNPTLFIRGGTSDYILDSDVEGIESIFLDSEIQTIDGSGHWVHAEAAESFLELALSFLLR